MKTGEGHRLIARTVVVGTAILLLGGCAATASSAPPTSRTGAPSTSPSPPPSEPWVEVLDTVDGLPPGYTESPLPPWHASVTLALSDPDDVGVLWIGIWSSSSCPTSPTTYSVSPEGVLTLTLESAHPLIYTGPDKDYQCTADLKLTSTAITVPDDVELSHGVVIREISTNVIRVRPYPGK